MINLKLKKTSLVFLLFTVLSALFFLINSLMSGDDSTAESDFFVRLIIDNIFHTSNPDTINLLTVIIRKLAHFTEFALFFGFFNAFMLCHTEYKNRAYFFLTLFLVLFAPLLDETIQYLSPGRTPQVFDIWVDAAGGLFGIIVSGVIFKLCRDKYKKKLKER